MTDPAVHLNLSPAGAGAVLVGDTDLSKMVHRLLLSAQAGRTPTLVLELSPRAYVVDSDGMAVGISPAGHHALTRLGWRPPEQPTPDTATQCFCEDPAGRLYGHAPGTGLHCTPDPDGPPANTMGSPALEPSTLARGGRITPGGTATVGDSDGGKPEIVDLPTATAGQPGTVQQLEHDRDALAALAAEILSCFTERGHPGQPCTRTRWVSDRTIAAWRSRLAAIRTPPDPPAAG